MRIPLGGLGLGAAILSGCGARREPTAHGRTVVRVWSMWTGDEEKVFQGVVDYYNRAQDKVYLQNLGAAADDKILRAITAGAPPDFFTLREPGYLAPLAANDALLPLDDWFRAAGFREADFVLGALELGRYKGKLYSMPYLLDAMALFYNPDHFKRAGLPPDRPPETLEQMLDYARRLTVRERGGAIRTLGLRPPDLIYLIGAFGGQFIDPRTGAPTADHPVNLQAARYYRALIAAMGDGKAVQAFTMSFGNEQGTNNPFFLGKIAMMINGQWNTYWFQKYAPRMCPTRLRPSPTLQASRACANPHGSGRICSASRASRAIRARRGTFSCGCSARRRSCCSPRRCTGCPTFGACCSTPACARCASPTRRGNAATRSSWICWTAPTHAISPSRRLPRCT
jgi:multiple sugar transport system substrate-binding protein